ncbi:MAG TPA: tetratricopeptide repeat protein [Bryobacteraceae bacterium]|nr:tetratricopeptide repeat protein [Bryobacteraceae bacterium]
MKLAILLLFAAQSLHFDITDARGKKPSGVSIETGDADPDGWFTLKVVAKSKHDAVLIWPFDSKAKAPDGPGAIPAIAIEPGDRRASGNGAVVAAIAAGALLGSRHEAGIDFGPAIAKLSASTDPFEKGVGLLYANKPADAIDPLGHALRERERQLTRVPSEIYPAAMLYGKASLEAGKFDEAAVAFLKAMNQRPSDPAARKGRAEALIKAGKADAARELLESHEQ